MWKNKVEIHAFYNLKKKTINKLEVGEGWGLILCVMHNYYIIKMRQSTERRKKSLDRRGENNREKVCEVKGGTEREHVPCNQFKC